MPISMTSFNEAIGVDVGKARIGIARVNSVAKIPQPLETIPMDDNAPETVKRLVGDNHADVVIVGLPTTVSGTDSDQTVYSREFAGKLKALGLNVELQDETLSTHQAEKLLNDNTYSTNQKGQKVGIDEVAACVILSDYLSRINDVQA